MAPSRTRMIIVVLLCKFSFHVVVGSIITRRCQTLIICVVSVGFFSGHRRQQAVSALTTLPDDMFQGSGQVKRVLGTPRMLFFYLRTVVDVAYGRFRVLGEPAKPARRLHHVGLGWCTVGADGCGGGWRG